MVEEYNWDGYEDYFRFTHNLYINYYKNIILRAFNYNSISRIITVSKNILQDRLRKIMRNATIKMICKDHYITEIYFYLNKDFTSSRSSSFSDDCLVGNLIFK